MDLFDLMSQGREDKALDRLEGILEQYQSEDEAEQDEALDRARSFCDLEWGSYPAGLEALIRRRSRRGKDCSGLAEEGDRPGTIIRTLRAERAGQARAEDERARLLRPTDFEKPFIVAVESVVEEEWGAALTAAHPLPGHVAAARAECLAWEDRRRQLTEAGGDLHPACARRLEMVLTSWAHTAPVTSSADFAARLEYWRDRARGDGSGYAVLADGFAALAETLTARAAGPSTKDRAWALRRANPDWSLARIGKELGISRQAVHKHLKTPPK